MKVAFPYPGYWPYVRRGIERCIHDVAGDLARRGHEVHVITSTPGRPRIAFEGAVKVTYVRQLSHPLVYGYLPRLRRLAFATEASRVLARDRADVAHLWNYSLPWAPVTRRWLDLPYVFQVGLRGSRLPSGRTRRPLRRLGTIDIRRADRVVALTPGGAAEVRSKFGVECGVLAPPVDMNIFRPVAPRRQRPEVLFTSDLADPLKGGRLLLRAWNTIHRECPDAVLVLAGPYGLAGYSQLPIAAADLAVRDLVGPSARDSVELRGPGSIAGLPAWYSQASVTVLPSIGEAFGMVLTESLACGTPVVASSGEGPGEIVTNPAVGRTVDLLTPDDLDSERGAKELADAVLSTIELSRAPGISGRCREWASRWGLDRIGLEEERLLQEVVDGHRRGKQAGA
jgi:glycosyltransferase involved in cell wall biosynthesis